MPGATAAALGQRIETARHAARLTRRQVCDASGVSLSMLRKMEGGERWPSDSVLDAVARAVRATPEELLDGPRRTDSRVHHAIPELQRVIAAYDLPDDGPVRPLPQLAADVDLAVEDRVQSQYARLAEQMPPLLEELLRAVDQARGSDREQVARHLALAIRSADAVAYKYGYRDLSARLVELMRWAASLADDPALEAAAAYVRMETYFSADQLVPGLRSLRAAVDRMPAPTTEPLAAAAAALHMRAAVAAGRMRRPDEAREHLRDAEVLAARVRERLYDGTAVGPDSLEIHRLAVAVEIGEHRDLLEAVDAAARWAPPRDLPAERRSHYYIDLGRAQMLLGQPQHAKESLLVARQIAPQHVREHGQVRAELSTMVRLSRGRDEQLLQFARWAKAV
ncbi:helix-turn-helix domain-containing protein [Kitasatospora aureofaciens]|uniref:helix-turn-helix domain-containing protein n=1 Tax=Kitasatospora aureofaciens TaxID=1894 RepID=UPI001C471129|nr:helix-turn-helix transcriptional regulator [Kitasatospora aureofaciens]MBV6697419.1 helix-turn-helix domain-containing protein [Kitasatospora aureofaciens]